MPDPTAVLDGRYCISGLIGRRLTSYMVTECFRVLKPGGKCGVTTWVTAGWTPDVREALATITGAPPFPEDEIFMGSVGDGKPWYRAEYVQQKLEDHGFKDVKVDVVPDSSTIDNAAAFVDQFSGMVGWFISKFWSEDDRAKYGEEVKPALMKYMSEKYPDGQPIGLSMAAIIASARKS
jgi:hypothetical protein